MLQIMAILTFIDSTPTLTERHRNVEKTRALSHAARVFHRGRKVTKSCEKPSHQVLIESNEIDRLGTTTAISHSAAHGSASCRVDQSSGSLKQLATSRTKTEEAFSCYDGGRFGGLRTDPFGIIPQCAQNAVEYYFQIVVPSYAVLWKIFDITPMVQKSYLELLHEDVSCRPMILAPALAIDPSWYPGKIPSRSFMKLHNQALQRLRRHLSQSQGRPDAAVVVAVCALAMVAASMLDFEAFKAHTGSLDNLISSIEDLDNMGRWAFLKSLPLQWETQWSYFPFTRTKIFRNGRPEYIPCFPSYPYTPKIGVLIQNLPLGFRKLAEQRRLSLRTLEVLARYMDHTSNSDLFRDQEDCHYSGTRRFSDFFEACPCIDITKAEVQSLEKLVIQALMLYCVHTWSSIRFQRSIYGNIRVDLLDEVRMWPTPFERDEEDVMIWVFLNLIDAWQHDGSRDRPSAIATELITRLRGIGLRSWGQEIVETRLRLFCSNQKFEHRCVQFFRQHDLNNL